ncbi:MAG: MopE-related protein [Bacteroidota bacterium]
MKTTRNLFSVSLMTAIFFLINTSISSQSTFTYTNPGTYTITAGAASTITITTKGADGGDKWSSNLRGGTGAVTVATFDVVPNDVLRIFVGESGEIGKVDARAGGGGGGGSAVVINNSDVLIVAGAGGGASRNGHGGGGLANTNTTPGAGVTTTGNPFTGGGGGGFNATASNPASGCAETKGGKGATLTTIGGNAAGCNGLGGDGGKGFGGGGGANNQGGGGGGGYKGGDGSTINSDGGDGGNSFVNTSIKNGTVVSATPGANGSGNHQNGVVIIEGLIECPGGNALFVKANATGKNNGTSWGNAFKSLQDALNSTCPGITEIWVAAGTYSPDQGDGYTAGDRSAAFAMKNGITIYGGFPKSGNPNMAHRKPTVHQTILSGDIGIPNESNDNSYHVISNNDNNLNSTAMIDGFIITNGNANGTGNENKGGGMYNYNSSPSVYNCIFKTNVASAGGAGVCNEQSAAPAFNQCIISGNLADNSLGGGMYNLTNCSPTVTNCSFSGNAASDGGAIASDGNSTPTVVNSILWGNSSEISDLGGSTSALSYSIVQGGHAGTAIIDADPQFINQPDHTLAPTPNGDLNTAICSPAVDAGSDAANSISKDFAGKQRKVEGASGGQLIDAGVYEHNQFFTYFFDEDADGYSGASVIQCDRPEGGFLATELTGTGDCADSDPTVNPGVPEVCDGIDNDCSNGIDDSNVCCVPGSQVIYVNAAATGLNSGASWADAYTDLQDALANTCPGITEIWVAEGTYKPTSGTNRFASFTMKNDLNIYGGFPNSGSPTMNDRDWEAHETILSGDIGTPNDDSDNSYHVIDNFENGLNNTAKIDGFTITKGNANGSSFPHNGGGGMLNQNSSPIVTHCIFKENSGPAGGGMYNRSSAPTVTDCSFIENSSSSGGGGMLNIFLSSPVVTNCLFSGNVATNNGGGLINFRSTPLVTNCSFSGNKAGGNGGGIASMVQSVPTVINCSFSGNKAGGNGGGIASMVLSAPTVINCSFSGNKANANGGALSHIGSQVFTVTNCVLWGNSPETFGGNNSNISVSYSIVEGGYAGTGNLDQDPLFVDQPDHATAPTTNGDLRVTNNSPAIDAGLDSANPTTEDLDNLNRKVDLIVGGEQIDMGAYELNEIDWYKDEDNDNHSDGTVQTSITQPPGYKTESDLVTIDGDCDDNDPAVHPDATEVCDGIDNDCDGDIDTHDSNLVDNDAPTAICQSHTVQLNGNGLGSLSAFDIDGGSNDACGIASLSASPNTFDCSQLGNVTVSLTVTDNIGNQSTCDATVTVEDNIAPVANCKNITVQLDANGQVTISEDAVNDGSSDACNITFDTDITSFDCSNMPSANVALTVTDTEGNSSSCNALVTVEDQVAPSANCKDITVQLDVDGAANIAEDAVNDGSADACGSLTFDTDVNSFTCADIGANSVNLTVTDASNNSSQCSATVTVQDKVGPTAQCKDISVQLDNEGNATISKDAINDNSSDACGGLVFDTDITSFTCADVGPNNVTLSVTDANNNQSSCSAIVTIEDFISNVQIDVSDETCAGAGDGAITISASAVGGQVRYSINGGQSFTPNGSFTNVTPGNYSIIIQVFGIANICAVNESASIASGPSPITWYKDFDDDGYTDGTTQITCTQPAGYKASAQPGDCDDNDPNAYPGQTWYHDGDNDGYTEGSTITACSRPTGYKAEGELINSTDIDCNDTDAAINHAAIEICNGIDDDCDGEIDEGTSGGLTYVGNLVFATQADIDAFISCYTIINGSLTILGSNIDSLNNLSNLEEVTGNVIIQTTGLNDLAGLESLTDIGGSLTIYFNPSLTTLDGFDNLTSVGGSLFMYYNFLLSDCCAFYNLLDNNGVGGAISIFFNAVGCNNQSEILACTPPSQMIANNHDEISHQVSSVFNEVRQVNLHPNPARDYINVTFDQLSTIATLKIRNAFGQILYRSQVEKGESQAQIDLGGIIVNNGTYFVSLTDDRQTTVRKLMVKR